MTQIFLQTKVDKISSS